MKFSDTLFKLLGSIPVPIKLGIIRGVKIILSAIVGWLIAQITAGTLLPEGTDVTIIVLTSFLLPSLDKIKRALDEENQIKEDEALTDTISTEDGAVPEIPTSDTIDTEPMPDDKV